MSSGKLEPSGSGSGSNGFKPPKSKGLNRPANWFQPLTRASSSSSSSTLTASTSSNKSTSSTGAGFPTASTSGPIYNPNPFTVPSAPNLPPPSSFKSPFPSSKGKHKLSPSPSPSSRINQHDEDFVMISPVRSMAAGSPLGHKNLNLGGMMEMMAEDSPEGSSPANDSPTPACGVASATARLRLVDDESPIRRVPGQSRSLKAGPDGGLFATSERRKQPSSPLKFAASTASHSMDEDENDQPPTPTTSTGSTIPQPLFSAARQPSTATAPQNLFGIKKQESRIPRLATSQPLRARSGTTVEADHKLTLGGKKAISLDRIPVPEDDDEPFGSPFGIPTPATGRKLRLSHGAIGSTTSYRAHKRINSGDQHNLLVANSMSMSRSQGLKSGLALSLSPNSLKLPEFGSSNSSLSSMSTNNLTPPVSAFSPSEPPIFEPLKPLEEEMIPAETATVVHKFKPRDSGVSMGNDEEAKSKLHPHTSLTEMGARQKRPPMLKRTSSAGDQRDDNPLETPLEGPSAASGWPTGGTFQFVGENGEAMNMRLGAPVDDKPIMPGTPVKKQAYSGHHPRIGHSNSQPSLVIDWPESGPSKSSKLDVKRDRKSAPSAFMPPPSTKKPMAKNIPHLTLTATSPDSPSNSMDTDLSSPTVRLSSHNPSTLGPIAEAPSRVGMLRRLSSGVGDSDGSVSEDEGTPTKGGGDKYVLAPAQASAVARTPTPKSNLAAAVRSAKPMMPRMSLPAVAPSRGNRTLHHRQSHPATSATIPTEEEDIFEERFITLDTIGKGAFSTVLRVQERYGEGIYAVKKARGVFEGARDRLRHLEEVDILRHLSVRPHPHVIKFEDAWEQNRQLFIQTELCLGSLAFFLLEYGSVVERLDEARVWKIVRELSDGIHHIHSNGVVHFDIKPANILISPAGSLKIGDFGLASRYPRVTPDEILEGSGLGGSMILNTKEEKLEREGDRVYMPPEMLRGIFVMAADIFSFGLVLLEVATNICVPDGGPAWQALRCNDFGVIDLSPLSPALADLITSCMDMEPTYRPVIQQIVSHPVIQRAKTSIPALAPQPRGWLEGILAGTSGFGAQVQQPLSTGRYTEDGDLIME